MQEGDIHVQARFDEVDGVPVWGGAGVFAPGIHFSSTSSSWH